MINLILSTIEIMQIVSSPAINYKEIDSSQQLWDKTDD